MLEVIKLFVRRMLMGKGKGILQIPPQNKVDDFANDLFKKFKQNGVSDEAVTNPNDVKAIWNQITNREAQIFTNNLKDALQKPDPFKKAGEVFDLKGKKIKNPQNIMGGEEIIETDAQILARLNKGNKESLSNMRYEKAVKAEEAKAAADEDYIMKIFDPEDFATGGRAGLYQGGQAEIEPSLSDIGHGSDALMARNALLTPGSQATTSTGLNYLLGEDNDTTRVPYKHGDMVLPKEKPINEYMLKKLMSQAGAETLDARTREMFIQMYKKKIKEKNSKADGGRTEFKWGGPGGKSPGTNTDWSAVGSGTKDNGGYQNVHQTGAVTQTPGRTVTTGGPPGGGDPTMTYTAPPVTAGHGPSIYSSGITNANKFKNWVGNKLGKYTGYTQHNINNQKLKNALAAGIINENQYKRMGGWDVKEQFPGGPLDVPMVGSASSLYNTFKAGLNIKDSSDQYSQYENYGPTQSIELNTKGALGLNRSDLQRYEAIVEGHKEVGGMLPGGHLPGINKEPNKELGEGLYSALNLANDVPYATYAEGGPARQNFGLGRRAFLKWLGSGVAGIAGAKSGLFGLLKGGGKKQVIKELTTVPINNIEGMPVWFKPLVNKVIKEGDDVTKKFAEADRQIVHTTKLPNSQTDVIVTQDLSTGNVSVDIGMGKHGFADGLHGQPVRLEYKAAEDIMSGPGDELFKVGVRDPHIKVKRRDEMTFDQKKHPDKAPEEFWVEEAEFTGGHPENVKFEDVSYEKFGQHGSNFDEVEKFATGKVKKAKTTESRVFGKKYLHEGEDMADGGRIGYGLGDKVIGKGIAALTKKAGEGKFTKNEVLLNMFKNTIKQSKSAKDKKMFTNFIEEIKLKPELSKDPQVWNFFTKGLPKNQRLVVYGDDTVDFWTQSEFGPHNIATSAKFQKKHPYLTKDQAVKIQNMEPEDQIFEMKRLEVLRKRTANATGGRVPMLWGGGIFKTIIKNLAKARGVNPSEYLKVTNYKTLPSEVRNLMSKADFEKMKAGRIEMFENWVEMAKSRKEFLRNIEEGKKSPAAPIFEHLEQSFKSPVPRSVTDKDILQGEFILKNLKTKDRKLHSSGGIAAMLGE